MPFIDRFQINFISGNISAVYVEFCKRKSFIRYSLHLSLRLWVRIGLGVRVKMGRVFLMH